MDRSIVALCVKCGFTRAKFEKIVGLPARTMDRRKSNMLRDPAVAVLTIEWRNSTLRLLLDGPIPDFPSHRILKSFFPNLREIDGFLYESLSQIQTQLQEDRNKGWTITDVWSFVCEKAQLEISSKGEQWRRMLRYMWQIEDFLGKNLGRLRETKYLATLVHELIGSLWGATGFVVKRALPKNVRPIPSGDICKLILLHAVPLATGVTVVPAASAKAGTSKKTLSERLIEKGNFCYRVTKEAREIKLLFAGRGKTIAEISAEHPEFFIWGVRDELSGEDRETFNHPRQWGPTVGYALMILGKQQGKSEFTIKEWIKAYRKSLKISALAV